jgi:NADH:ubiquinone oxidoreductase subunit 3 (subunit A)
MPTDVFYALILLCCAVLFMAAAWSGSAHRAREMTSYRIRNFPLTRIFALLSLAFLSTWGLVLVLPWAVLSSPIKKAGLLAGGAFLALVSVGVLYALGTREAGE